jgi:hypothetical protein
VTPVSALTRTDLDPQTVRTNAEYLMHALGRTADAVAAALMAAGFTGTHAPDQCPVGRYLLSNEARLSGIAVGSDVALLDLPDGARVCASVPEPVSTFINMFDLGRYPGLVASSLPTPAVCPGTPGRSDRIRAAA